MQGDGTLDGQACDVEKACGRKGVNLWVPEPLKVPLWDHGPMMMGNGGSRENAQKWDCDHRRHGGARRRQGRD